MLIFFFEKSLSFYAFDSVVFTKRIKVNIRKEPHETHFVQRYILYYRRRRRRRHKIFDWNFHDVFVSNVQ